MPAAAERLGPAVAAAGLAATVLVTWPLWTSRTDPPNLPALTWLEGWPCAPIILAICAVAIVAPRFAAPAGVAGAAVVAVAVLGDEVRLQPEVVSLALLMAVLPFGPRGRAVARWHLGAMWLWAGLHKALSAGWSSGSAVLIADSVHLDRFRWAVILGVPALEMSLGLASFVPRLWPAVRIGAVALHGGILLTLSPFFSASNRAVWAWNAVLGGLGFLLFRPDRTARVVPDRVVGVVAVVLVASPALFYVGSIDAYLSHNLYTSNTASAVVCSRERACYRLETFVPLSVPLPPERRLFDRWFEEVCQPGDVLTVIGRSTRFDDPADITERDCP